MSHPSNRAHRRHHRARLIDKRVKQRPAWFIGLDARPNHERLLAKSHARLADTATPCSCAMCGNPRRYFKDITLAEKRADLRGKEVCDILEE